MIVELVDNTGTVFGRFQSPAAPRRGEQVRYDESRYVVEDVIWRVESDHHQNVQLIKLLVEQVDADE